MFRWNTLLFAVALAYLAAPVFAEDETNVTAKVAAAVKDGKLDITVGNELFGDTAPSVPKKFSIEFSIGDKAEKRVFAENAHVQISAPAGTTLTIKRAIYGPADGSTVAAAAKKVDASADPEGTLATLPGFKVELVLKADRVKNGSWINMCKDPKGRLLLGGQRGQPITRLTLENGKVVKEEILHIPVSETMGMLFVDNVLYINGAGASSAPKESKTDEPKDVGVAKKAGGKGGPVVFGLFRCTDAKGDDSYDSVEFLREWHGGAGEHGAHGIVLGPDKKLYCVNGNFTGVPEDLVPTSPHRNYADDLVLKRAEDGNGFGAGKVPPGGYVARFDLDGKNIELFASGQRNTYDIAFNADGELFGFDSDMEWDWGNPWYRPIRVFHAVRGGDTGFREGSAKWPEYYVDSLPANVTIGIGCPTGVGFGTGAKFPLKYQKAFYILDWTYGRLIAVHLKPNGASYTGTWENFVAPKSLNTGGGKTPLNLTDVVVGNDGAMYFTVGGRGTAASLFRVTYTGAEPATPAATADLQDKDGAEARALRHKLEDFNVKADPAAVAFAWPHLNSPDRFIRYAARLAIERNPVAEWQAKALEEKQPNASITALLALARLGEKDTQPAILKGLAAIPNANLSEAQLLEKLRVIEVSIARQGVPTGDVVKGLLADVDALYPAKTEFMNRELCQILLAVNAPNAVARTIALLTAATTQEEQVTYIMHLRNIKSGWTPELRKPYFTWFNPGNTVRSTNHPEFVLKWYSDAGIAFNNGNSFARFMSNAHEEAKFSMSHEEVVAMNDILTAYTPAPPKKPKGNAPQRKVVKEWTTADLQPSLDQVGQHRNFQRGKSVFEEARCVACHRYGDTGGAVGPDLTTLSTRYKRQDMLESITEPSKVLSEQYMNTRIKTKDGLQVIGRIADENKDQVVIRPDPLENKTVTVKTADIALRDLSKVSPMPEGLLNNFTKEEILDLLAFLESLGNKDHPNFK